MDSPTPDAVASASSPAAPPGSERFSWWDRVNQWRSRLPMGRALPAATLAGAALAIAVALLLLRAPSGPPPQLTLPRAAESAGGSEGTGPVAGDRPAVATVHAAGAVAHPGVYAVPIGARVADDLAAAGGPVPEADLDRLNLAAKVADGDRLLVPRKGDPAPGGLGGSASGESAAGGSGGAAAGGPGTGAGGLAGGPASQIDLNTATAEQLDTLPGVGPATARAIITYRTRAGRFRSVTELLEVPGIGPTKMEALRPLVRV